MFELTKFPDKIMTAKTGDVFLVNGEKFVFEGHEMQGKCFLTKEVAEEVSEKWWETEDSDSDYAHVWVHVRDDRGVALFKRKDLVSLLQYGQFQIY